MKKPNATTLRSSRMLNDPMNGTILTPCVRPSVYAMTAREVSNHRTFNGIRAVGRMLGFSGAKALDRLTDMYRDSGVWVVDRQTGKLIDVDLAAFEQSDDCAVDESEGRATEAWFNHHFGKGAVRYLAPRLPQEGIAKMMAVGTIARIVIAYHADLLDMPVAANDNNGPRCPECGRSVALPL